MSQVRPRMVGLCAAVTTLAAFAPLQALKAAGLKGLAPSSGAGAFQQLVGTLTDNWKWLISTGVGLVRFDPAVVRERWASVGETLPDVAPQRRSAGPRRSRQRRRESRTADLLEFDREP